MPETEPPSIRYAARVAPGRTQIRTRPVPRPGPDEVVVALEAAGVCASELAEWRGPVREPGIGFGHEPYGTVVSIGGGAASVRIGDRVTGRFGPAFADLAVAPATSLVRVPDGIGDEAVLGEPLGCLVEAIRRSRIRPGDRVAIVGLGFMGLGILQLVRLGTPAWIMCVDPRSDTRRLAHDSGADETLAPDEIPADYRSLTMPRWDHPGAFDVVIEASGTQAGLSLAGELVRGHGTLAIVGYHQGGARSVDLAMWNWKAIDVVNAHVRRMSLLTEAIARGLALMVDGRLDLGRLITHRMPLDRLDEALELLERKPNGFVKAVVTMDGRRT